MSPVRAWWWKETREQRRLVGALLALVVPTVIVRMMLLPSSMRNDRDDVDLFPGLTLGLATLVLGADLFARDLRRGLHGRILQLPGAMRAALGGKLLALANGALVVVAVEEVVRLSLAALTGHPYGPRQVLNPLTGEFRAAGPRKPELVAGVSAMWMTLALAAAVAPWHAAGSTWSGRAGPAFLGAIALAGAALPLAVLASAHMWWFQPEPAEAFAWLAAVFATGLVVLAVSWLAGRRALRPEGRGLAYGLVIAVAVGGAAAGLASASIDRWLEVDPGATDLRIEDAIEGEGGRFFFARVARGADHPHSNLGDGRRGTPGATWVIDASDGSARALAKEGGMFFFPLQSVKAPIAAPTPWVIHAPPSGSRWTLASSRREWIDGRTAERRFAGDEYRVSPEILDATRATWRAITPLRDSQGRRLWWFNGRFERDGDPPQQKPVYEHYRQDIQFIGWGFVVPGERSWSLDFRDLRIADATTERARAAIAGAEDPDRASWRFRSSGESMFLDDARFLHADSKSFARWTLFDVRTGAESPVDAALGVPVEVVAKGRALWLSNADEGAPRRFRIAGPGGADAMEVTSDDASLLTPLGAESDRWTADGRLLLAVETGEPNRRLETWTLLDPKTGRLERVSPSMPMGARSLWMLRHSDAPLRPIAVEPDGAFVAIEGGRRIVRFRDHGQERTVLFPKPR